MTNKLKLWKEHSTWEEAENAWEEGARYAEKKDPIKRLTSLPSMPGMTEETAKNLKWKSLKWMIGKDHEWKVLRKFFKHPFKYGLAYLKSILKTKSYGRDGDFFLYGIKNIEEFASLL